MENDPQPDVFHLANTGFDFLQEQGSKAELLCWFEIRLLHALGYAPALSRCAECRTELPVAAAVRVAWASHGALCDRCARRKSDTTTITPDIRAVMQRYDSDHTARTVASMLCTREQLRKLQEIIGALLSTHLELAPESRKIALGMLESK